MNLNSLKSFLVIEQERGVVAAAKKLGISQPALSHQMKQLEDALEHKLFAKRGRHTEITEEGRVLLECAKKVQRAEAELKETLQSFGQKNESTFRIGISEQLQPSVLADLFLESRLKAQPLAEKLALSIFDENVISSRLEQSAMDLALMARRPTEKALRVLAKIEVPVGLMVPNSLGREIIGSLQDKCIHSDFRGLALTIKKHKIPFLMPTEKYFLKRETDEFFTQLNIKPNVVMKTDSLNMLIVGAIYQKGVAVLPWACLPIEMRLPDKITCIEPPGGLWKQTLWLTARAKKDDAAREKVYAIFAKSIENWKSLKPWPHANAG